jgi:hypothetical protein
VDGLEFTSTLIGHVFSWPVAVVVVGLALRKPLTELLPKLKSYEGLGQKLSFGDRLAETEESVEQAAESISQEADRKQIETPAEGQEDTDTFDALALLAANNPSYAIVLAFGQVERALNALYEASLKTAEGPTPRNTNLQLKMLQQHGVINEFFVGATNDLKELRDRIAHGQHNPTSGEAVTYVKTAQVLTMAAHALAASARRNTPPSNSPG